MIKPAYTLNDTFPIHFVWKLESGDFLRAIFTARVLEMDWEMLRYRIELETFTAGRQESEAGELRGPEQYAREDWARVAQLVGKQIKVAFEVDDGRPIRLKRETLTGENQFFFRQQG
ncbi:MAG: hypothetical protein KJ063_22925 [Anaerolineae bacterium]|nr:hypothetical protein [Anaerolineae bacterium]